MRRFAKPLYALKRVPGVRIPPSPPENNPASSLLSTSGKKKRIAGESAISPGGPAFVGQSFEDFLHGKRVVGGESEFGPQPLKNLIRHSHAHIKIQLRTPSQERVNQRAFFKRQVRGTKRSGNGNTWRLSRLPNRLQVAERRLPHDQ